MSFECSVCAPGKYTTTNELNMRSHLGSRKPGHNMGPFVCQVQGCDLRAVRDDNAPMHGDPSGPYYHQAQYEKDATLEQNLIAFAKQCLVVPAAQTGPAAPNRPVFGPERPPHLALPQEETEDPEAASLPVFEPHGAPFHNWMKEHIHPTLVEGFKLLREHQPEKPLKAFGELFLGNDIITGCVRHGFHRGTVAEIALETGRALAAMQVKPQDPKKWFGEYLLARSAEFEG